MAVGTAQGQIAFGDPPRIDAQLLYQSWKLTYRGSGTEPETTLTQTVLPLHVYLPLTEDWELHFNSAYSRSFVEGATDSKSISTVGSPMLRIYHSFSDDRLFISGGLALPLGKTDLDESTHEVELAELLSSEYLLLPVKQLGYGLGLLVSAGGASQHQQLLYGGSVTYRYAGSYTYIKRGASYDPGDEFTFRGSTTLPVGQGRIDFDLAYKYYLSDKLDSKEVFKNGDQFSLAVAGSYDFSELTSGSLSINHIRRSKDSRRSGAVFAYELHNTHGAKTVIASRISYLIQPQWRGNILISYRYLSANDWTEDDPSYFGSSNLFRIGGEVDFARVGGRYQGFGRLMFSTGAANDDLISISGLEFALGGSVRF
ncbi:MAG: hypothetical protein ABIJ61_05085 [bacterium]